MKNLVLHTEQVCLPPSNNNHDESDHSSTAVDFCALEDTVGAFAESFAHNEDSNPTPTAVDHHNDGGPRCLVLHRNGILQCQGATTEQSNKDGSSATSRLLWQVNLNSVLEQEEQEETTGWFSVQVLTTTTESDGGTVACCLNSVNGAIVKVVLQSTPQVELVGEFEQGILAAAWSPDGQVLALVVNQNDEVEDADANQPQQHKMLLTMTNQFEMLSEIVLDSSPIPTAQDAADKFQVSLCWRPDGKWLAVLSSSSNEEDDKSLVLRIYDPSDLEQSTPAFGRTEDGSGKLLKNFGGTALSWAGAECSLLLATVQSTGSKTKICLIESNGLAHGGFPLRDKKCTVHQLQFSATAQFNLLAVHLTTAQGQEKVQLWHRSNYHWYLKQEFRIPNATTTSQTRIARLQWQHPTQQQRDMLSVLWRNGTRQSCAFGWRECVTHQNTALVVDGCDLKVTPLAKALVPPPMAAHTLTLPAPVRHIALAPSQRAVSETTLMAVLHLSDNSLVALVSGGKETATAPLSPAMIANDSPPQIVSALSHEQLSTALEEASSTITCAFDNLHIVTTTKDTDNDSVLRVHCLAAEIQSNNLLELSFSIPMSSSSSDDNKHTLDATATVIRVQRIPLKEGRILAISHWEYDEDLAVSGVRDDDNWSSILVLEDGRLLEYKRRPNDPLGRIEHDHPLEPLLEPCPWVTGICRRDEHDEPQHRVIGMSWRNRLYCGEVLLADSVSSFAISDRFLCYATAAASTCELRFIAKSQLWALDPFMGASEENAIVVAAQYEPRKVERGSRIVTLCHNKPLAVMQLPRGNLEGVYPRALVLPHILGLLRHGQYCVALETMRQQKVDLNLLCDWNPEAFLNKGGAEDLLSQVSNVDHLNLFISSLRNENVTQTTHPLPMWLLHDFELSQTNNDTSPAFDFASKVNQVCRKLRSIMADEAQVGDALLLPVLSTFAKEEPPQLESALSLIQTKALEQHKIASVAAKKKPPLFSERAQSSIQYLAFLATYEMLFDTALSMYDLDLARAVARNSQMDPKKYLPLLKRYKELPDYYARYEMDLRLKQYDKALRNLVCSLKENEASPLEGAKIANSFEDCMSLIKQHKLHRLGLELFANIEQQREILIALGEHLLDSQEAQNALTILLTIGEPAPAPTELILRASRACQDWRTYFSYAVSDEKESVASEYGISPLAMEAKEFAQEMISSVAAADRLKRQEVLSDAARITLDYGKDPSEAVDILIQGELWAEARRVAELHKKPDLVAKCTESAASQASSYLDDLSERAETFATSMERYMEVLRIRKDAYARGEDLPPDENEHRDESASLFSAASQASHLTGMTGGSGTSTSSTSTSASHSTVISVQSKNSTFSISGSDHLHRHKSKYNELGQKVGGKQKKKKKKSSKRSKVIPGSEKELENLVEMLQLTCFDSGFSQAVADCIVFLCRTGNLSTASTLYRAFQESCQRIVSIQEDQQKLEQKARQEQEEINRREGIRKEPIVHPLEKNVNAIDCANLTDPVHKLIANLPS